MEQYKNNSRRKFLQSLSVLSGATIAGSLLPDTLHAESTLLKPANPLAGHVFTATPYLQHPTPDSMVVMFITNLPSYSWVEYGETDALGQKAQSVTNGLVDAYTRINRIRLNKLKPGTKYYYRVVSKEITYLNPYSLSYKSTLQSDVLSFTTPLEHPEAMTCLIMNDLHDKPESIPHLMKLNGGNSYDFVFFNGDVFNWQVDEQQIVDHMLQPCISTFASEKPFLYVRGNHETRGQFRRELHHYFCNPQGNQYYTFTWGPVHFTVLDTGEDKTDDHREYSGIVDFDAYREQQQQWLNEVFQSRAFKKAPFKVVLMHIPPFYSGDWHGTMHCRELFNPLFNKHHIDMCISGHTHTYGVHAPEKGQHQYPVIIGGGPKEGTRTLIKLQAEARNLRLTMLDDSGKEVGNYTVSK
ncbi:purple acid phosphatase family protein [Pinibacter soli]|uniref:Metallophosphoesterase family protein n=1 Tax=Pinibacter soli TaxID=3044211 RepID=A0ABT6R6G0_9BACT|nr:metallophosphoesterase family protein [Pinibacter soli]MDI3318140.1 metallophosphoesterase family protein [Pinibacter soli]